MTIALCIGAYFAIGLLVLWACDEPNDELGALLFWLWPAVAIVLLALGIWFGPTALIRWMKDRTPTSSTPGGRKDR